MHANLPYASTILILHGVNQFFLIHKCTVLWFCLLMAHPLLQHKTDGVKNKLLSSTQLPIISPLQLLLSLSPSFLTLVANMSQSVCMHFHLYSSLLWQLTYFYISHLVRVERQTDSFFLLFYFTPMHLIFFFFYTAWPKICPWLYLSQQILKSL